MLSRLFNRTDNCVLLLLLFVRSLIFQTVLLLPPRHVHSAELVEKSIVQDTITRWYIEYRPDSIAEITVPVPIVVLLHGGTQSMRVTLDKSRKGTNRWLALSEMHQFVLLVPNAVNLETGDTFGDDQNWSDLRLLLRNDTTTTTYDDVGFISQLVKKVVNETTLVDADRVYVTGGSNGGLMTYTMLLQVPELFAAGAAFIANLPNLTIAYPNNQTKTTTPIMIMNGNKDRLMLWNGGTVPSDVGGTVRSTLDTRDFWITANQASVSNVTRTTLPNHNWLDRCRIQSELYSPTTTNGSSSSSPVQFYIMDGGGHNIPTRCSFVGIGVKLYSIFVGGPSCHDANGADLAWEFMSSYTNVGTSSRT